MPRVAVLLTPVVGSRNLGTAAFAHAQSGASGQILFWAASKPFVASWVSKVPSVDAERFSRLRAMFTGQGCTRLEEEPVGSHAGSNLICHLIFAAAYDANDKANNFWHALQLDLDPAEYAQAQSRGIFLRKEFDVPEGTVGWRVGVYDPASGPMGTLDIPLNPAVTQP